MKEEKKQSEIGYTDGVLSGILLTMILLAVCLTFARVALETKLTRRAADTKRRAREEIENSVKSDE